jgi:hypothetical protein
MPENRHKSHKHRHKKKDFFGQLLHKTKIAFRDISFGEKKPKEYRPYLGQKNTSVKGRKSDRTINDEGNRINEGPSVKKKHHKVKKRADRKFSFSYLQKEWKSYKRKQKKKKTKKKTEKRHKSEFRRQQRLYIIRKFIPNYKGGGKVIFDEPKDKREEREKRVNRGYFYYTINSTALYIIAYLLVYMVYQLTVLVVASRWGLDSVLYYYDLAFNDYSPLWSRYNIIVVTFSGPFISLVIGFVFYKWVVNRPKVKSFLKLFVLWIGFHGFNLFLGAFVSGVSFDEGFGYVANWLFLNVFWKFLISLVFLSILSMTGYFSAKKFLETSNSILRARKKHKTRFLFHQVVLPWFIGSAIILLVKIPNNMPYETGILVIMMFMVVPVLFNLNAKPRSKMIGRNKPTKIIWTYIIILLLVLTLYRVGLDTGYHIVLKYKLSISINPV